MSMYDLPILFPVWHEDLDMCEVEEPRLFELRARCRVDHVHRAGVLGRLVPVHTEARGAALANEGVRQHALQGGRLAIVEGLPPIRARPLAARGDVEHEILRADGILARAVGVAKWKVRPQRA